MDPKTEYERVALEILQDQRIRVTLFTFSITTVAAIIGVGYSWGDAKQPTLLQLITVVIAAYTVLIPCLILVLHYTRGINCKCEYLNIAHKDKWAAAFDKLTEVSIPGDVTLSHTHRILVLIGGYSSENAFRLAYVLINVLIACFATAVTLKEAYGSLIIAIWILLFALLQFAMQVFRPISKHQYRELWRKAVTSPPSSPSGVSE